jgi:hypothetical protein
MPVLTATARLDMRDMARMIERRTAPRIALRAQLLGVQMEKIIAQMIDGELGPSSGRAGKRGMVPMRSINWTHKVDNPGHLPISVTMFSTDLDGPTGAKFGALNYGWQHTHTGRPLRPGETRTGGYGGRQWLKRTAVVARGRAGARFI